MKQDILQKPWTEVTAVQKEDSININLWGREYVFRDSMFPAEIKTAGKNILAAPITLRAFLDSEETALCDTRYFNLEQSEACCEFGVAQRAGNVIFDARVRVEYDGLIRVKFCVLPFWNEEWNRYGHEDSTYRLNKLFIDIPLKKEYSDLYHYYPNDGGSTIVLFTNDIPSGHLPAEGLKVPFKPYTWLGWEEGGLSLCCETDQNLELADKNCAMEYETEGDTVHLKVHLLDDMPADWQHRKEMWADGALPIEFEYGLQATPVKPRPNSRLTDYQIFHMDGTSTDPTYLFKEFEESEEKGRELIKSIADKGAKYFLILGWTMIMNYWKPYDHEKFKKFVEICQSYGVEPVAYFGYELATIHEDWFDRGQEYLQKNTEGRLTDGWLITYPRRPWHRAYTMCLNSSYGEVFLNGILECMDTYGVKGIYLDGTFNFWECANEAHGCGYVDKDGKRHHTYPVYAVREFAKKLHYEVAKRGGILHVHQSGTCSVPTMAFSDVVLTGESVMGKFRDKEITMDAFRAEHSGMSTGINMQWIAVEPPDRPEINAEWISCQPMLHGVMPMPRLTVDSSLDFVSKIWKANNSFGVADSEFIGYWEAHCPVHVNAEKVYASVYKKKGTLLAVVSNLGDEKADFTLEAEGGILAAKELIHGVNYFAEEGKLKLSLEANRIQMIQIKTL